uniref:DUF6950 domain-containing protein n=1 Tax=Candidatus Kentrum sp. UNK TaxID=2126344 RepID=A0A451AQH8_9GAMM|nr:MAG: hypothetical protein BECKUNK1418G_GA0071005_100229 [Candidatus Kentron sp. UNK]VFK68290.1 MAG: hypothetical protein BECKUNK1418H_GA0071006_100129 [Candidatus Kentron sp. UNK]
MVARREDWDKRLVEGISHAENTPFRWGTHDCVLFAGNMVLGMTGHDYVARFRERYHDERSAFRLMREAGFASLPDIAESILGAPDDPASAMRGDVILLSTENGPALGISFGKVAMAPGPKGLLAVSRTHWKKAWSIG